MEEEQKFNFEKHARDALNDFITLRPRYVNLTEKVASIIKEALMFNEIYYHSIEKRCKSEESFLIKCMKPNPDNPKEPKYPNPLNDITDLSGVRIITFFNGLRRKLTI